MCIAVMCGCECCQRSKLKPMAGLCTVARFVVYNAAFNLNKAAVVTDAREKSGQLNLPILLVSCWPRRRCVATSVFAAA